ncbi:MAG: hypothetical protein KMY55_03445 [Dethiosulfatibacter sp.]|nr:hypothetical protein [Dethiosulfatibacter sp.]
MKNRVIAMILIVSLSLPLVACGGKTVAAPVTSEKLLAEAVLNDENLVLGSEGVELRLDPVIITSDVKAVISEVNNAPALDDEGIISLKVYDFKLENVSQVDGVIQLAIPLKLVEGDIPGAAYLNEETGKWEPVAFMYDKASTSVIIFTDHLSKYGVFSVSNSGKRNARIEFLDLYGEEKDEDFQAAIEEYAIGGVPAKQCFDIGAGAAGEAMQLGGDFLGNITQSVGYMAYGDDVLSTLGDRLGSIGLLLSVVQVGANIYNGKINDAVVGSLKASYTYILGKVASKLSSSVMSASMASIAIVDYAINKFGTTAIQGRADIYRDAYSIYYFKGQDGFKASDYWYRTFYPMFSDPTMTEEALKTEIDKIVTTHCNEFWTGTNKLGVDYYVTEARQKMAWTGGGAGLNQDLQKNISQERRSILYNDVLPGVFRQIALRINMENETKLRAEYKALSDYLNKPISFSVTDTKKTYAKHQVRFSPLNDKAEIANWTGKFKDDGTLNTAFTVYGHMVAGSTNKLDIYAPDADMEKDEPVKTIEFKVTPPAVEIELDEKLTLVFNGVAGQVDYIPEYEYEAIGWLLGTIEIGADGTINQTYGGGKSLKLKETWLLGKDGSGATITLTEATVQGNYDAVRQSGKGTLSVSWKFLEEGGTGLEYEKYDIKRTFNATFDIAPAYSGLNKSRGQIYIETIGPSVWDITYTGEMYDVEKQEHYIGSETFAEKNEDWGGTYAFEINN